MRYGTGADLERVIEDARVKLSTENTFLYKDDVNVVFCAHETFSDTSLGGGGMAGQSISSALTTVVCSFNTGKGAVYRSTRFDYEFDMTNEEFRKWMGTGKQTFPPIRTKKGLWLD